MNAWQRKAVAEASAQDVREHGESIEYWLPPSGQVDFNGRVLVTADEDEPVGPFTVCDPRCNCGTLTDEQVFEYVLMTHGVPPLMFQREPWGDEGETET